MTRPQSINGSGELLLDGNCALLSEIEVVLIAASAISMSDDADRVNRIRPAGTGDNDARHFLDYRTVMRLYARTIELESIQKAHDRTRRWSWRDRPHRWRLPYQPPDVVDDCRSELYAPVRDDRGSDGGRGLEVRGSSRSSRPTCTPIIVCPPRLAGRSTQTGLPLCPPKVSLR